MCQNCVIAPLGSCVVCFAISVGESLFGFREGGMCAPGLI